MYALPKFDPFEVLHNSTMNWQAERANDIKIKAAQQEADNTQQALAARQALDFTDPNALKKYAAQYPEYSKGITDYLANLSEQERQALLADTSKVQSLLNYGDTENAVKLLEERAVAYDNAKNPNKAADYRSMAGLVKTNKNAALQSLQMLYSTAAGKDAMAGYKDFMGAITPTVKEFNSGGETGAWIQDPYTGEVKYQKLVKNTIDPTQEANFKNQLKMNENDNATSRANNINTNNTQVTTANINQKTQWGVADRNNTGSMQRTQKQIEAEKAKSGKPTMINGYAYMVYPDNTADPIKDPRTGQHATSLSDVSSNKPMPASALTLISNSRDKLQSSQNTISKIDQSLKDLDPNTGKLKLGLLSNAGNVASNWASKGDESSLAYERLVSNRAGLVNEVLTMAKGTQTEGDAQRAAKVVMSIPLTDNNAVINAFSELRRVALRTVALEQGKIEEVYQNYGKTPPNDLYASTQPTTAKPQQQASSKSQAARDKHFTGK